MNSLGSGKFEIVDFPASVDLHFDKEGLKIKEIEAEISFEFFK